MYGLQKYRQNRDPQKPKGARSYPGRLASGARTVDPFEMALVISMAGQIVQKDSPDVYQRILVELRELYREETPEKLVSVCWRLFSLYRLIQSGALAKWVSPDSALLQQPLPAGVIFVTATLPLEDSKGFNASDFIAAVQECMACEK